MHHPPVVDGSTNGFLSPCSTAVPRQPRHRRACRTGRSRLTRFMQETARTVTLGSKRASGTYWTPGNIGARILLPCNFVAVSRLWLVSMLLRIPGRRGIRTRGVPSWQGTEMSSSDCEDGHADKHGGSRDEPRSRVVSHAVELEPAPYHVPAHPAQC